MATLKTLDITTLSLDVSSDVSVAACASGASKLTNASFDTLVNDACGGYNISLLDAPLTKISKQFDLNLLSTSRIMRGFVDLICQFRRPGGALPVNNTSLVSILSVPLQAPYSASKAAASSITERLRLELQLFLVQVVELKTTLVKTGSFDNGPEVRLPADSHYGRQRELVERTLKEGPTAEAITTDQWADQVARDLSHNRPSPQIYRGGGVFPGRIAARVPIGVGFNVIKDFYGVTDFGAAYQKSQQSFSRGCVWACFDRVQLLESHCLLSID